MHKPLTPCYPCPRRPSPVSGSPIYDREMLGWPTAASSQLVSVTTSLPALLLSPPLALNQVLAHILQCIQANQMMSECCKARVQVVGHSEGPAPLKALLTIGNYSLSFKNIIARFTHRLLVVQALVVVLQPLQALLFPQSQGRGLALVHALRAWDQWGPQSGFACRARMVWAKARSCSV